MSRSTAVILGCGLLVLALGVPVSKNKKPTQEYNREIVNNKAIEVIQPPSKEEQVREALTGVEVLIFKKYNCRPCMHPNMVALPDQLRAKGIKVREVYCEENPQLQRQHNITVVPTTVVTKDGREVDRQTGVVDVVLVLRTVAAVLKAVIPWILSFWGL